MTGRVRIDRVVVTCEHGGNRVPQRYRPLFRNAGRALESHRGYDIGALPMARAIAAALRAPLHAATTTRLVIDLNRSLGHRASLSEFVNGLDERDRAEIIRRHYTPYRTAVENRIGGWIAEGHRVLHISVHSFTPVLQGVQRTADVGLLYDPHRAREKDLCDRWLWTLGLEGPQLRRRRNYPYLGRSDGFTTSLRRRFPAARYLGVELEVNQALLVSADQHPWLRAVIVESLQTLLGPGARGR